MPSLLKFALDHALPLKEQGAGLLAGIALKRDIGEVQVPPGAVTLPLVGAENWHGPLGAAQPEGAAVVHVVLAGMGFVVVVPNVGHDTTDGLVMRSV